MEFDEINSAGNVTRMRFKPAPGYHVPEGSKLVKHKIPFEIQRLLKKEEIENSRNLACYASISVLGHRWQADKRSQELLTSAINFAINEVADPPSTWRSENNEDVFVSLQDLKTIGEAMALQTKNSYSKSWDIKNLINTASTEEELGNISWD
jgi:hypothetical protein